MRSAFSKLFLRYQTVIIGALIVALALGLRTYKLGSIPAGLSWDEAAIGYNGYAIGLQRRDEWLVKLPLVFKSFGEYKPPIAIYSVAVTSLIFGPTTFAIRLPMALAGVLTVLASFALAKSLLRSNSLALFVMMLVAVSPLNIHFSRIAFESSIGVALIAIGAVFFLWAKEYTARKKLIFYFLAGLSFALTFHTNHATKMIVPFVVIALVWTERAELKKNFKIIFISVCIAALGVIPLLFSAMQGIGNDRLLMTSALFEDGQLKNGSELISIISRQTLQHLDPRFLFFGQSDNYRHGNGVYGIFSFLEGVLVLAGIGFILIKKSLRKKYGWLVFLSAIALIPAIISNSTPHPNRVHHLLPWAQIIAGIGLMEILAGRDEIKKRSIWGLVVTILVFQLLWQLPHYYSIYGGTAPKEFQYGYAEAVQYAQKYESEVDEIYFTDAYQQSYIYLLLFKQVPPISYHHGALIKYRLGRIRWEEIKNKKNVLIIASPREVPAEITPTQTIFFPNGETAFVVIKM